MKKIILFADPGIDDAIALLYALRQPSFDILAVVAEYGNTFRRYAVSNSIYLLHEGGRSDIPVFTGAERPITGEAPDVQPTIHGPYGLGDLHPFLITEQPAENIDQLIPLLDQHAEELTIVTLGRLTTLAALFLLYPALMKRIKEFHLMGGAFSVPGNITPFAEANIYDDPAAAKIVVQQAANLTMIPLNVTNEVLYPPEFFFEMEAAGANPLIRRLAEFYQRFNSQENGSMTIPVHDLLTLVALAEPSLFTYSHYRVAIITAEGLSRGMTVADMRPLSEQPPGPYPRIALDVNAPAVLRHVFHLFTA
ncbi:nucleoside hydrolase [Halalkalibacter oceani]|uniref:nucleoside hydrolase n=1 Tax=Halalkalibacter oceani TaxID=1653776 RepID=UPI00339AC525